MGDREQDENDAQVDQNDEEFEGAADGGSVAFRRQQMARMSNSAKSEGSHRYDEFSSFRARSERSLNRGKEKPLSDEEETQRSVHFVSDDRLQTVFELEPWNDGDKARIFMSENDWSCIDRDVEITKMRWHNHKAGKIPFDYKNNTLRGLEAIFHYDKKVRISANHCDRVLDEIVIQKRKGVYLNMDRLGAVCVKSSKREMDFARHIGKKDHEARITCWSSDEDDLPQESNVSDGIKPKNKFLAKLKVFGKILGLKKKKK